MKAEDYKIDESSIATSDADRLVEQAAALRAGSIKGAPPLNGALSFDDSAIEKDFTQGRNFESPKNGIREVADDPTSQHINLEKVGTEGLKTAETFFEQKNAERQYHKGELEAAYDKKIEELARLNQKIEKDAGESRQNLQEVETVKAEVAAIANELTELNGAGDAMDKRSVDLGMAATNKKQTTVYSEKEIENEMTKTIAGQKKLFSAEKKDAFRRKIPLITAFLGSAVKKTQSDVVREMAEKERATIFDARVALNERIKAKEAELAVKDTEFRTKRERYQQSNLTESRDAEEIAQKKREIQILGKELEDLRSNKDIKKLEREN